MSEPAHRWRWSRAEIEAVLGHPILVDDPMLTTRQVAALLDVTVHRLHYLVKTGRFEPCRPPAGYYWRLSQLEHVDQLLRDQTPGPSPTRRPTSTPDPVHAGRVPSGQAAAILGVSPSTYREAAAAGTVPAVRDRAGHWWARPEDLAMIRRAREMQAEILRARLS